MCKCHSKYLEETLILEDLTASGYVIFHRFKSVNWKYAAKAIEDLAKFHSLSLAFQIENPELFYCLTKDLINMFFLDPT